LYARGNKERLFRHATAAVRVLAQGVFASAVAQHPNPALPFVFDHTLVLLYRLLVGECGRARGGLPAAPPNAPDGCSPGGGGGLFDAARLPLLAHNPIAPHYLHQALDCLAQADVEAIARHQDDGRFLGCLYEYLLGYHLALDDTAAGWDVVLVANRGTRRATGSFYTPDAVVRPMVAQTLAPLLQAAVAGLNDEGARVEAVLRTSVLDPALGSGVFLLESTAYVAHFLLEQLQGPGPYRAEDIAAWRCRVAQSCIYGVEIHPLALDIARLSFWLATAPRDMSLSWLDHRLCPGDALVGFDWHSAFPAVMGAAPAGFSAVLGNPPYLRQEAFAARKPALARAFPDVYHGSADLSAYFVALGLRLLRRGGRLSYITSGTFRKLRSGAPLRRSITSQATLLELVDVTDQRMFRHTITYPVIMTLAKEPPPPPPQGRVVLRRMPPLPDQPPATAPVPTGDAAWIFPRPALRHLFEGWGGARPLGDMLGGPICRGVTTGCNRAFVIDRAVRDSLVQADPASADLLKPVLRGEDLYPWCFRDDTQHWLICTPRGVNIEAYPAVKGWLSRFRDALEPRPRQWHSSRPWPGRSGAGYQWYELQSALTYQHVFEEPHLQSNKVTRSPAFSLAPAALYATNTAYVLPLVDVASGWYLLGVLHSRVCAYYSRQTFSAKACGYYEVQPAGLSRFPVPDAPPDQRAALATLARRMRAQVQARQRLRCAAQGYIMTHLAPPGARSGRAVRAWWTMDIERLGDVVARWGGTLAGPAREEWAAWLEQQQAQHRWYTAEIEHLEYALNQQVYALCEVGPAEQRHIEQYGCEA